MARVNVNRTPKKPFAPGDWVWVKTPRSVGGLGLRSWWYGPCKIAERNGQFSFNLFSGKQRLEEVHADQLKPYLGGILEGDPTPMFYPLDTAVPFIVVLHKLTRSRSTELLLISH